VVGIVLMLLVIRRSDVVNVNPEQAMAPAA
jgi:hypothetical protein